MFSGIAEEFNGNRLYKYYSYNDDDRKMFAPILDMTLRYKRMDTFNDPYDCYIGRRENGEILPYAPGLSMYYVCSMTTSCDNFLMWSHYASNHKGFVVEYDAKKLKGIERPQIEIFSKVSYSDEIYIKDFISSDDQKIVKSIYHKASCWSYEDEIRSVIYDGTESPEYRVVKLDESYVTGIFLGSQFLKGRHGKIPVFLQGWHKNNKLYYMQLQSDKYKLEKMIVKDTNVKWCCPCDFHCGDALDRIL